METTRRINKNHIKNAQFPEGGIKAYVWMAGDWVPSSVYPDSYVSAKERTETSLKEWNEKKKTNPHKYKGPYSNLPPPTRTRGKTMYKFFSEEGTETKYFSDDDETVLIHIGEEPNNTGDIFCVTSSELGNSRKVLSSLS